MPRDIHLGAWSMALMLMPFELIPRDLINDCIVTMFPFPVLVA